MKQFNIGFLVVTCYPQWVANVVLVPKKDGKVWMCVDYKELNRASPKDDFPLPHIDIQVDNTAHHKIFSFMDGFFWLQSDQDGTQRHGEDNLRHTVGYFLLQGNSFWVEKCWGQPISDPWSLCSMI